jgi:hypothetical protein
MNVGIPVGLGALTRRRLGTGAAGLVALLALGYRDGVDGSANRGRKGKGQGQNGGNGKGPRCRRNGQRCRKDGSNCKRRYCLEAPFDVTVEYEIPKNHETFLFVPKADGATNPAPFIKTTCSPTIPCDTRYPFACIYDGGLTRFHRFLDGTYEFWVNLAPDTDAGEVTVTLHDRGGRVVRTWENPQGDSMYQRGWHVFDVDGERGSVVSIDQRSTGALPGTAYDPNTDVCPGA